MQVGGCCYFFCCFFLLRQANIFFDLDRRFSLRDVFFCRVCRSLLKTRSRVGLKKVPMLMVACLEMTSWDRAWSLERSRVESMLGNKVCIEWRMTVSKEERRKQRQRGTDKDLEEDHSIAHAVEEKDELSHKNQKVEGREEGARVLSPAKLEAGSSSEWSGFPFFSTPSPFDSFPFFFSLTHNSLFPSVTHPSYPQPTYLLQRPHRLPSNRKHTKKKNAHTLTRHPPIQKGKKENACEKKEHLGWCTQPTTLTD